MSYRFPPSGERWGNVAVDIFRVRLIDSFAYLEVGDGSVAQTDFCE
jgi:hypothetical protein